MNIKIREAKFEDYDWLKKHDELHLQDLINSFIENGDYLIAEGESEPVGFLRYSMFWRIIPYMEMIRINKLMQGQGIGTRLFQYWEQQMIDLKAPCLMTSSVSDEDEPQMFHKKMGFEVCGILNIACAQQVPEKFFIKNFETS